MKLSVSAFAALLITGSMFLQPAHAQSARWQGDGGRIERYGTS